MSSKSIIFFANPYLHHSFFTYNALATRCSTVLVCPPLQIKLFLREWKDIKSQKVALSPFIFGYQLIAIICYLCYKIKAISHEQYLTSFNFVVRSICKEKSNMILVSYQDYVRIDNNLKKYLASNICEFIIKPQSQVAINRALRMINISDIVVYPSGSVLEGLPIDKRSSHHAQYGGNKLEFFRRYQKLTTIHQVRSTNVFKIAARSNSFRKGVDILLDSLVALGESNLIPKNLKIKVLICGTIYDSKYLKMLEKSNDNLALKDVIEISFAQYSQFDYLKILQTSDLFIMPSRQEGSSPAALEALYQGLPAILSRECGIDNFKHMEHGLILESLDANTLFVNLHKAISQPLLIREWRNKLRRDQQNYAWEKYFKSYNSLLDKVL